MSHDTSRTREHDSYLGRPTTPFGVDSTVFVMANAERIREQYAAQRRVPGAEKKFSKVSIS